MTSRRAFKHYDERVSRMLQFIPGQDDPNGTLEGHMDASHPLYPLEPIYIDSLYITSDLSV